MGAESEDRDANGINGPDNDDAPGSGAVYVFVKDEGNWSQQAYVKASNTDSNGFFGSPVALSSDGDTLAVASSDDSNATGINGDPTNDDEDSAGVLESRMPDGIFVEEAQACKGRRKGGYIGVTCF